MGDDETAMLMFANNDSKFNFDSSEEDDEEDQLEAMRVQTQPNASSRSSSRTASRDISRATDTSRDTSRTTSRASSRSTTPTLQNAESISNASKSTSIRTDESEDDTLEAEIEQKSVKIQDNTVKTSTVQQPVKQIHSEQAGHYFEVVSKTFYHIRIVDEKSKKVVCTHRHKSERAHGTFDKWPSNEVPRLPKEYPWEFLYPMLQKSSSKAKIPNQIGRNPTRTINRRPYDTQQLLDVESDCSFATAYESTSVGINDSRATGLDLPGSPTRNTNFSLAPASPTAFGNDTFDTLKATIHQFDGSPTSRPTTPIPDDVLEEFLLPQPVQYNAMVYGKYHDSNIYPAYIITKNPDPSSSKLKLRFQDDNSEKEVAKHHILRCHLLPKSVHVCYTHDGLEQQGYIESYCLLDSQPGYIIKPQKGSTLLQFPRSQVWAKFAKVPAEIKNRFQIHSAPVTPSRGAGSVDLENLVNSRTRRSSRGGMTPKRDNLEEQPIITSPLKAHTASNRRGTRGQSALSKSNGKRRRNENDSGKKRSNKRLSMAQENTLPMVPE